MKVILIVLFIFMAGFTARDLFDLMIPDAKADVAGKNYADLVTDFDFRQAVEQVIEDYDLQSVVKDVVQACSVDGGGISC